MLRRSAMIAFALGLALPAAAHARIPDLALRSADPGQRTGPVYTDGRYVLLTGLLLGANARVRDDQTGRTLHTGCQTRLPSLSRGTTFVACAATGVPIGSWSFTSPQVRPTGLVEPGAPTGIMGRYWVELGSPAPPRALPTYYNWHTGEQRSTGERVFLDAPTLTDRRYQLLRDGVVQGRSSSLYLPTDADGTIVRRLRLRVGDRVRTVRQCPGAAGCGQMTYSAGILSWREKASATARDRAFAYRVSTKDTYSVRLPDRHPRLLDVNHTSRALYINAYSGQDRVTVGLRATIPQR